MEARNVRIDFGVRPISATPDDSHEQLGDWKLDSNCLGMPMDTITADTCDGCPVAEQCAALFADIDSGLELWRPTVSNRRRSKRLKVGGVWGGEDRTPKKRFTAVIVPCDHEPKKARGACNKCYMKQRWDQGYTGKKKVAA